MSGKNNEHDGLGDGIPESISGNQQPPSENGAQVSRLQRSRGAAYPRGKGPDLKDQYPPDDTAPQECRRR